MNTIIVPHLVYRKIENMSQSKNTTKIITPVKTTNLVSSPHNDSQPVSKAWLAVGATLGQRSETTIFGEDLYDMEARYRICASEQLRSPVIRRYNSLCPRSRTEARRLALPIALRDLLRTIGCKEASSLRQWQLALVSNSGELLSEIEAAFQEGENAFIWHNFFWSANPIRVLKCFGRVGLVQISDKDCKTVTDEEDFEIDLSALEEKPIEAVSSLPVSLSQAQETQVMESPINEPVPQEQDW